MFVVEPEVEVDSLIEDGRSDKDVKAGVSVDVNTLSEVYVVEAEEDEVGYLVDFNEVTVAKVIVVDAKGEIDTLNV